jgi:magnesium-transporting ATPase (P-type)
MKKRVSKLKNHFDRTQFNLATILIGGAGILTALTHFNVPELNMVFLGENPFAIKRDVIEDVVTWTFTSLALVALLLQIFAEVCGESWPQRKHSKLYYFWFSVLGLLLICGLVWLLTICSYRIAKTIWWPKIVQSETELFKSATFLVEHDGWRPDQINLKDKLPESYRTVNLEAANENISQIEKLLELPSGNADISTRISRLKLIFEKPL